MKTIKSSQKPQSKGGQATAIARRRQAAELYYQNPNHCLHCKGVIPIKGRAKDTRRYKFCSKSCAAIHNNTGRNRHAGREPKTSRCSICDAKVSRSDVNVCQDCYRIGNEYSESTTKGSIFARCSSRLSALAAIRRHSRLVYTSLDRPKSCEVCGYALYVEVCHIRPVRTFPPTAVLGEINSPHNLVGLCPNHHWELDHGVLSLDE